MVDVLFGESEAGTMRDIKLKHRRQSGGRDEVICLGFMLDAGDRSDLLHVCTGSVGRR